VFSLTYAFVYIPIDWKLGKCTRATDVNMANLYGMQSLSEMSL